LFAPQYLIKSVVVSNRHLTYMITKGAINHVLVAPDQACGGLEMAGKPEMLAEIFVEVVENGATGFGIPPRLSLELDSLNLMEYSLSKQLEKTRGIRHLAECFVRSQEPAFEEFLDMMQLQIGSSPPYCRKYWNAHPV
jgi:hypothetical protein